jgi:hypothetical protein
MAYSKILRNTKSYFILIYLIVLVEITKIIIKFQYNSLHIINHIIPSNLIIIKSLFFD